MNLRCKVVLSRRHCAPRLVNCSLLAVDSFDICLTVRVHCKAHRHQSAASQKTITGEETEAAIIL